MGRYVNNLIRSPHHLIEQWIGGRVSLTLHGLWKQSGRESALNSAYKYVLEQVYRNGKRSLAFTSFWLCLALSVVLLVVAMNWYPWFYSASTVGGLAALAFLLEFFYSRAPRAFEQKKFDEAMAFIALHDQFVNATRTGALEGFEKKNSEELKSFARDALVSAALTVLKIEATNKAKNIPRVHWDEEHTTAADRFKELYALMQALRLLESDYTVDYGPYYSAAQALLDKAPAA